MKRERRHYGWLPVFAWMIVIFILSAQPADQSVVLSEERDALLRGCAQSAFRVHRVFHPRTRDGRIFGRHSVADSSVGNASG